MVSAPAPKAEPASPCTGVCLLDQTNRCTGCLRTLDEIAEWGAASAERKRAILRLVAERRKG